jgi:hypothetical protein
MTTEQARKISMLFEYVHMASKDDVPWSVQTLERPQVYELELGSSTPQLAPSDVQVGIISTSRAWRANQELLVKGVDLTKGQKPKYDGTKYFQANVADLKQEVLNVHTQRASKAQAKKPAKADAAAVDKLWKWVVDAYDLQDACTHSSTMLGGEGGRLVLVGRGNTLTHFHLDYSGATCDAYEVSDVHVFMYMCTFRITSHV